MVQVEATASAKVLCVLRCSRGPVWLEWSEQSGRVDGGKVRDIARAK